MPSHLIERVVIVTIADVLEKVLLVCHDQNFVKRIELGRFLVHYVELLIYHLVVSLGLMDPVVQHDLRDIVLY